MAKSKIDNTALLEQFSTIEGFSFKKMFGGMGLFHDNKMFGLIDSKGVSFLKVDDTTKPQYLELGSTQHSRMPYYTIPEEIKADTPQLVSWTEKAIAISK